MAFNNEKFRLFWRFDSDAGRFVASSTAQGYDVDNLKRDTLNSKWKSRVIATLISNGTFETGDFTGWTANNATIDSVNPASGTYDSKLVAATSDPIGAESDLLRIDSNKVYKITAKIDVDVWSAGAHRLRVNYYNSGSALISSDNLDVWTAATAGYETVEKTIGPASMSPDFIVPAAAVFVTVQNLSTGTATGTAYMDDVSIIKVEEINMAFGTQLLENGNFETGDFTGWTAHSATVSAANPASGTYSSIVIAAAASPQGAESDMHDVDIAKTYAVSAKVDVDVLSAGAHALVVFFYDAASNLISQGTMESWIATTNGYEIISKRIGPANASPDIIFPAGTAMMTIEHHYVGVSTGTVYMDDASICELDTLSQITGFALLGHDIISSDSVQLEYADDVDFTVNPGSVSLTYRAITLIEYFAAVTKAFWRVLIIPSGTGASREAGRLLLGDHYQMERNIILGWSGPQYTQDTSRSARTEGGQSYSDIGTPLKTFQGRFTAHSETDLDELEALKSIMLTGQSFVISQNWEDFPVKRTLYGKLRSLGQPSNVAADKWTLPFSMVEQK